MAKKKQKFFLGTTRGEIQQQVIIRASGIKKAKRVMEEALTNKSNEYEVHRIKLAKNAMVAETTTLKLGSETEEEI